MHNKPRLSEHSDTDVRTQEQEHTSLAPNKPEEDATRPHPLRWILFGALILVVVIGAGAFILLPHSNQSPTTATNGTTGDGISSAIAQLPTLTAGATNTLQVKTYQVSSADAGLMPPVADQHGNLWFGEMSQNKLMQLDTTTGKITNRPLPADQTGIMNTAVDAQGNIWFANQTSNSIGRFTPQTQQFKQFPLPKDQGKILGIQDLHVASNGQLWFTALSSGQLGQLDPQTGATHLWSLPAGLYPSSITTSANGLIWVGMLSGGTIGRFNPASKQFTLLHLSDPQSSVSALANDNHGHLWFIEMHAGILGEVDINSNPLKLKEQRIVLPNSSADSTVTLTGLAIAADGTVWLANPDNGILLHYQPGETHFTIIHLAQTTSKPYILVSDMHGKLWFTASDTTSNIGQINT